MTQPQVSSDVKGARKPFRKSAATAFENNLRHGRLFLEPAVSSRLLVRLGAGSVSVQKSSHGTVFLIVSSGSPLELIASSLRSTSKKPFCPMTRSLHSLITACGHRVRFVGTWREEFFEVPLRQ